MSPQAVDRYATPSLPAVGGWTNEGREIHRQYNDIIHVDENETSTRLVTLVRKNNL